MMNKSYYSNLRFRFSFLIIAIAAIPLLLITWSTTYFYHQSSLKKVQTEIKRTMEKRKAIVSLFLQTQEQTLKNLVNLFSFEELSKQQTLEKIYSSIDNGCIVDLGIINDKGNHIAYVGPYRQKLFDQNYAESEWFQEIMINRNYISDIFTGYRNIPHFIIGVADPLKKWVLRATINSNLLNSLLRKAQLDEHSDAFIVNRQGLLQTPSQFGIKQLSKEEESTLVFHEGTEVRTIGNYLYVTSWLKEKQWLMLVKVKKSSVLKEFYQLRNRDMLLLLVATIVIILATILIVRYMVGRIAKADITRANLDGQLLQVEKMASLGRLAAGVAHEINNPLQLITVQSGWISELLDEEDPECIQHHDEYRNSIKKIRLHVKRAASVTHRLLGFSRKMTVEKEVVDINSIITETISFLENEACCEEITIKCDLQKSLSTTMTDASQIQQVFLNLLNNGMDAVGKNGIIEITTTSNYDNITIAFTDNGPGISSDILETIFDPFFTTKEPGKGTGLGLSICYNIIQKLGGTITAENHKQGGAVFTIILPIIKLNDRQERVAQTFFLD